MKNRSLAAAVQAAAVLLAAGSLPVAAWSAEAGGVLLQDLVVRGDSQRDSLGASSATVLDHHQIASGVYVTPVDILKQSPGISVMQ